MIAGVFVNGRGDGVRCACIPGRCCTAPPDNSKASVTGCYKSFTKTLQWLSLVLTVLVLCQTAGVAQTVDDGVMIPSKTFFSGYLYTHDSWDHYWEGTLSRANGNIGTLTSQTS